MNFSKTEAIFDTLVDTRKIYVSMEYKFTVRKDVGSGQKRPIYLSITGGGSRERIHTRIFIDPKYWDKTNQRIKPGDNAFADYNLVLDAYKSKIHKIKIEYWLSEQVLTPELLRRDLEDNLSRVNFCAFFGEALKFQRKEMADGTYNRHKSVLKKLSNYQQFITFSEINQNWIALYKNHLRSLGNKPTTINANMASIKKFLTIAKQHGIKLPLNVEDIKVGSTRGNRNFLNERELKVCWDYFGSEYINSTYKIVLGYFLFGCFTGLRISDIQKLTRSILLDNEINFVAQKTNKFQSIKLNRSAKSILATCPDLFETKYSDQVINRILKTIMVAVNIKKRVSFHVSRHTFATCFLRRGGKVEMLQKLLGHSDIKETMIYVHILQEEANKEVYLLDGLFD